MGNIKNEKLTWVQAIEDRFCVHDFDTPGVSCIIPTYNCFERIARTLESLKRQEMKNLECIIVDGGSKDRTLEVVSNYFPLVSRVYTVKTKKISEMINQGISLCSMAYITILLPGSFYLNDQALKIMGKVAIKENFPTLFYCGTIQKQIGRQASCILSSIDASDLQRGIQPATLLATWVKKELFVSIGLLHPVYGERTTFDFFCRLSKSNTERIIMVDRVLVDYDYGLFSYAKQLKIFKETAQIIFRQFGWLSYFRYLIQAPTWKLSRLFYQFFRRKLARRLGS